MQIDEKTAAKIMRAHDLTVSGLRRVYQSAPGSVSRERAFKQVERNEAKLHELLGFNRKDKTDA